MSRVVESNNCPDNYHGHCFAFGCDCTHKSIELCHKAIVARNNKCKKGFVQFAKNRRWIFKGADSIHGRLSIKLCLDGKPMSVNEIAKRLGLPKQSIVLRLNQALRVINPEPKPDDETQTKFRI